MESEGVPTLGQEGASEMPTFLARRKIIFRIVSGSDFGVENTGVTSTLTVPTETIERIMQRHCEEATAISSSTELSITERRARLAGHGIAGRLFFR